MEGPTANSDAGNGKCFQLIATLNTSRYETVRYHIVLKQFCVRFCEYSTDQMDIRHAYTLNTFSQVEVLCCYGF